MITNEKVKTIFLVDDNITYLNTGKKALKHKYTVITIPSGEKLLLMLKTHKPDLILLDVAMPGMSGYDVIKKIKASPKTADIPIIFLTGKDEPEDEVLGLSLGAVDYITKPFSPSILTQRVSTQITLKAQKDELRYFNENLCNMVEENVKEITNLQNALITWTAEMIEFRDAETGQHVDNVQKYMGILLEAMKQTADFRLKAAEWDSEALLKSSALHDVGKIKIRDAVLLKPSKLDNDEFNTMKKHTSYGRMLIEHLQEKVPSQMFLEYAKILAYSHHERWDGKGYPENLKGEEIPLFARMMALADVYDALISKRPYKKAFSHEEAMKIIAEGRGTQFDPILTDLFIEISHQIEDVKNNNS